MEIFPLKTRAFGLDISQSSLKLVSLLPKRGYFEIEKILEKPLSPEIIQDGEIVLKEKLKVELQNLIKEASLKTKEVVFALPEEKTFLEIIRTPKMEERELASALGFEIENYIPLPIHEVYYDFQVIPPVYENLNFIEVLLVASPRKTVETFLEILKEANLVPVVFEPYSLALARAIIKNQMSEIPVLIVNIGTERTHFIVFSKYSVVLSLSCPVSSQTFTQALVKNLNISETEAEKLKKEKGLGEKLRIKLKGEEFLKELEKNKVFEALIGAVVDLSEQIRKCIFYYQRKAEKEDKGFQSIGKIIICGEGSSLKGLKDFLSFQLNLPVEIGDPLCNLLKPQKIEIPLCELQKFVVAIGLALRGSSL